MSLPAIPDYTCPDIDEVLTTLEKVRDALDDCDWNRIMEDLRSANDALRQNYEHQEERADQLEKDLEKCQQELSDSQDRVEELEQEIKGLESQSGS